jgi:anti-anti-sigma factor
MSAVNPLVIADIKGATVVTFQLPDLRQEQVLAGVRNDLIRLVEVLDKKEIMLDMRNVRFAASRFLGILVEFFNKGKKAGAWMAIIGMRPEIRKPADLVGIGKLFKFFPNEEEAMNARPNAM